MHGTCAPRAGSGGGLCGRSASPAQADLRQVAWWRGLMKLEQWRTAYLSSRQGVRMQLERLRPAAAGQGWLGDSTSTMQRPTLGGEAFERTAGRPPPLKDGLELR